MENLIDFNQAPIKALLSEVFESAAHAYFRQQPQPDPQYSYEEVAELLGVDVGTVRGYAKLPATHQRHLPVVRCTDSARGHRIRLSAVRAWQERNSTQPEQDQAQEPAKLMQISHRRVARRNRDAA